MGPWQKQVSSQMLVNQAVAFKTPFASQPLNLGLCRFGTIQLQAAKAQNAGGARVKIQGTNVGIGIDPTAVAASGRQLDLGGANPTDLGWTDLGYMVDLPPNLDVNQFIPPVPGGGTPTTWDVNWIRLVVVAAGPGGITLNAWAKFKSGI